MYTLNDWFILENNIKLGVTISEYYEKLLPYVIDNINVKIEPVKKGKILYRARVFDINNPENKAFCDNTFEGFNANNCLAPPAEEVKKAGRINLVNESVLYTAEDEYTALSECRAGKKQTISIAELELLKDIIVFPVIFKESVTKADSVEQIYRFIALRFFITVYDEKEYLVSQYISKKIKDLGFDGVKYSSSLAANGINIALFDTGIAKPNKSKLYLTQSVLFYAERMKHDSKSSRLIPKSITDKFTHEEIDYFFNRMK